MQKSTENQFKSLSVRIISIFCFIFVLLVSPVASLFDEQGKAFSEKGIYASVAESAADSVYNKQSSDNEKNNDTALQDMTADEIDEAEDELMQSETETYAPKLSESYMLRELFSSVDFPGESGKNEAQKPVTEGSAPVTKENSEVKAPTSVKDGSLPKDDATEASPSKPIEKPSDEKDNTVKANDAPTNGNASEMPSATEKAPTSNISIPVSAEPVPSPSTGKITTVNVLNHQTGTVTSYDFDEYLAQVIISEMPSYAGDEALRAQAVASRTFVVNRIVNSPTHSNADVCTNPGHCQAFTDKSAFISKYGTSGQNYYDRAYNAAKATSGIIMTYNNSPITAAYHASSGGSTMSSADVWGGKLPYLVSVYSPEQDDPEMRELISAHKTFSKDEFISRLTNAGFSGAASYYDSTFDSFVGQPVKTSSGKVDHMTIAGENVSGQTLQNIFSLRSSSFTVNYDESNITFVCMGYGHGVGMSQLGACTMAKQGYDYASILKHYYTGVSLSVW